MDRASLEIITGLTCNQVTNRRLFGERNITIAPLSRQFPIDGVELLA
jgi:hypothetical protein